jgi:dihydrofolate reductase
MSKIKVSAFSISIDGFGAGLNQDLQNPLGIKGTDVHTWIYATKTFHKMIGKEGGEEGIDNSLISKIFENTGSYIMGRNMFGPVRGAWINDEWNGWWGEEPPFHAPVFVLTHHKRAPLVMKGGTTFYFITEGIEYAVEQAKKAAGTKNINISGGVSTIRQMLQAGLIDEMHLALSSVFLGDGENLFAGINIPSLGFTKTERIVGENATHFIISKQ